jgi:hypothetical protein
MSRIGANLVVYTLNLFLLTLEALKEKVVTEIEHSADLALRIIAARLHQDSTHFLGDVAVGFRDRVC